MSDDPGSIAVLVSTQLRHSVPVETVLGILRQTGYPVSRLSATTRAEAIHACESAVASGATALVAIGGDGTVHLALQACAEQSVGLGMVPAGTGNDFAMALGVPADPIAAAKAVQASIANRQDSGDSSDLGSAVDLCRVEGPGCQPRWFGTVLSAGFDTLVNARANQMAWPRGPRRYDLAIMAELAQLRPHEYRLRLDHGPSLRTSAVIVAVGNTSDYGGGLRICPQADPRDGALDVVIGSAMGRATLIRLKPRVRAGTHLGHRLVSMVRATSVEIDCDWPLVAHADGEPVGPLPLTVACVPRALRVLTSLRSSPGADPGSRP